MEKVRSRRDIFLSYILPGIGGMLGVSLYVLGDTMLVGRGLTPGLTALNIAIPMINVLNAFGLMFGIGGATLISKALGRSKPGEADRLFPKPWRCAWGRALSSPCCPCCFWMSCACSWALPWRPSPW